jgi:hypothetical protein
MDDRFAPFGDALAPEDCIVHSWPDGDAGAHHSSHAELIRG